MKKSYLALLGTALALLLLMLGFFLGRNLPGKGLTLPASEKNSHTQSRSALSATVNIDETEDTVGTESPENTGVLNINTATAEQFTLLPGIGEVLAQRIVDYRAKNGAFREIEDLKKVSGIGEKKFAQILPYITVGG